MKNGFVILLTLALCTVQNLTAQVNVGIGTDFPDAYSMLDVKSVNRGLLIPRMTTAQRGAGFTAIGLTQEGMLIYNLTDREFNYWNGTQWIPFPSSDDDWYDDSTPAQVPDNINDNIYTNGRVGIGISSPTSTLHIGNTSAAIQSIRVQDLAVGGNAYNPSVATIPQNNRAAVFVDRTTGIMYSEDANRAFWRLDGNAGVVNAGYAGSCPNMITTSMNASGFEYLGTNDNTDFIVATNDRERLRVLRDGQLVAYGKGIVTPASSPTGCVPAYPVIDAASFYGVTNTYPLNAYSENVPAVYGTARDMSGGFSNACGVQGVIYNYGSGVEGISTNATSGNSVGVLGEEPTLWGWAILGIGDIGSTTGFYLASDAKLKERISSVSGSIDLVMQLKPKNYYIKEPYHAYGMSSREQYGFLAQDVEEVLPMLVKHTVLPAPHAAKGKAEEQLPGLEDIRVINYAGLIPILTGSIQEQQAMIGRQQTEIEDLKAAQAGLLARIALLEGR